METGPASKLRRYRDPLVAEEYDRRWEGRRGARRNRRKARALEAALASLETAAGQRLSGVLDAPCGTGRFTRLLLGRSLAYCGAELSLPMLLEARKKAPAARFLAGDLARLPLADGAVDAAICIRFLHLVRDPGQRVGFLRELARVARLGVIVDYRHGRTLRVLGRRLRHRVGLLQRAPANPSPRAIRSEVAAAGLEVRDWITVHAAPLLSDKALIVATPTRKLA